MSAFDPTTDGRLLRLDTPLGKDCLLPTAVSASERVSGLFGVSVDALAAVAKADQVTAAALLGKSVTAKIAGRKTAVGGNFEYTDEFTFFNGIVTRLSVGAKDKDTQAFELELAPWLWTLTQASDCRVYQNKDVKEVVSAVFDEFKGKRGISSVDYKFELKGAYTRMDYCVQYRETHFNFVSRLLEQEGLHYFFEHSAGGHTLVVTDDPSKNTDCEHQHEFALATEAGEQEYDADVLYSLSGSSEIRPGRAVQRDYHFQMADRDLQASADGAAGGGNGELELFDYPGEFAQRFNEPDQRLGDVEKEGEFLTKLRAGEESATRERSGGSSSARTMRPGRTFQPLTQDGKKIGGPRLLLAVSHSAVQDPGYRSAGGGGNPYSNTFSAVTHEKATPFRPARATPKPVVQGLQNALVTGPQGEEIHTDKYGRIRVQFPWDREGKKDEKSACWVRVAQSMAGEKWGGHFWPRIGQEVLVAFMEGDPDAPIVVGSVYNSKNMPPYEMPGAQTRSGFKTRSTPEGKPAEFNELRFEDKRGSEEIYVHAEKDLNAVVENNETRKVGYDAKESAGSGPPEGHQTEEIWHNRTATVGGGKTELPSGGGMDELTVYNGQKIAIGDPAASDGGQTVDIEKDRTVTLKQGNDKLTLKMGDRTVELKLGSDTLDIKAGKRTVKAMQSIELSVGSSSIKLDPSGITLQGIKIAITGQAKADVSSPLTTVTGSGILTLGGALTKIG
ncbi:type VI secretion system Vgr family protein [Alienimonas californiensis]|uniref:Phage-related baseplate assembly protein n=1 Tax=Alienimonas californiensis TaxID=2527989 RepID=A0A517P4C8_9PLAN|nr:type VI secretion system tip protein TssI/VgrG [Alienimonas californiensis]QDT14252.1 Phage-related baseplate assembly protein [Alienimonas californiensis]